MHQETSKCEKDEKELSTGEHERKIILMVDDKTTTTTTQKTSVNW